MHARVKHNAHNRIDSILCMHCDFQHLSCACTACVALRTTAWKPTFKSVFCILMSAALFWRSAREPAVGNFLFHDGWAVYEIRRSMLVQDIIIKASALNKWTPVLSSACVVGWHVDLLEVCWIINSVTVQRPLSAATQHVYSSPSMKKEHSKATCMTGAFQTHPSRAVWCLSYVHHVNVVYIASGVSHGAEREHRLKATAGVMHNRTVIDVRCRGQSAVIYFLV